MIAVAKFGGHQAIVTVGEILRVDKIDVEVGKMAQFETLLIADADGKNCTVGAPMIEGKMVEAKVLDHARGDKIKVYKMKPRKRYRRTIGHRQDYTEIEITSIGGVSTKAKPATKKEEPKAEKTEAKKAAPAAKAPADKKPAVKKVAKKDA